MLEIVRGALEGLSRDEEGSSSGAGTSDASGDNRGDQGGDGDNRDSSVSQEGSTRVESPMPWEGGLIAEMEREVMEAGAGGGSTGWTREYRRVGVGTTLMCQPARIKSG